jgi:L-asparaginase II
VSAPLPLLAEVVRSGYVEGGHTGSLVAVAADGTRVLALGDLERPVFPRSSTKPLQAVGLLAAGWEPADDREVALATASHSGEPEHLDVVRRMLAGAGCRRPTSAARRCCRCRSRRRTRCCARAARRPG